MQYGFVPQVLYILFKYSPGRLPGRMAEPELLLDSNIRLWVVLPIVFITFLVGVIRHYVSILLQSDKKLTLEQVSDRCVKSLR